MENLEILGLKELKKEELIETEGGSFLLGFVIGLMISIAIGNVIIDEMVESGGEPS